MDYSPLIKKLDEFVFEHILLKISDHYHIPILDLQNTLINKPSKPIKKKTSYQNFFAKKTNELKHDTKDMSFGDISKHIAQLWNSLSKEERDLYSSPPPSSSDHSPPFDIECLVKKKLNELRDLCLQWNLKPKRTRQEMIHILTEFHKNESSSNPVNESHIDTIELEDYESTLDPSKSNNMMFLEDEDEEEEDDFHFKDENEEEILQMTDHEDD
jgi:hypothetical protein